jgi:MFS superfamily sulfate permease-like transporter
MNFLKSTKTKQILKTVLVTTLYITAFTIISDDLLFGIAVGTALGVVLTDNDKKCCK